MDIKKCLLTKNDCYKAAKTITPTGIVVHSTGANNPYLKRYVQPDDGILGVNQYKNDWNRSGTGACVHAFIGKDKNGKVRIYQTLPLKTRAWGCGSGSKGSYNNSHIQFEICEDALNDEKYFNEAFALAIEFCQYLMDAFNIPVENVVSHKEANKKGYATNHGDCDHWLARFGKDMNWFRSQLNEPSWKKEKQQPKQEVVAEIPKNGKVSYKVKITADSLNVRAGAGTKYKSSMTVKKGEVYTIIEEKNGWGKLKSGAGWISLKYTKKV